MLKLDKLESISKKRKRVGRGGDRGGTSGKGHKGQRARTGSGSELKGWFEGGQMSLTRRLPKRGFTNRFKKEVKLINLNDLEKNFSSGDQVNKEILRKKGLLKGKSKFLVKILGNGKLTKNLAIHADSFSKAAMKSIQESGGTAELIKKV